MRNPPPVTGGWVLLVRGTGWGVLNPPCPPLQRGRPTGELAWRGVAYPMLARFYTVFFGRGLHRLPNGCRPFGAGRDAVRSGLCPPPLQRGAGGIPKTRLALYSQGGFPRPSSRFTCRGVLNPPPCRAPPLQRGRPTGRGPGGCKSFHRIPLTQALRRFAPSPFAKGGRGDSEYPLCVSPQGGQGGFRIPALRFTPLGQGGFRIPASRFTHRDKTLRQTQ